MARRRTSLNTVFALILFLAVAVVVLSWAPSLRRPVAAHFMLPDPGPIRLGDPIVYQGEEIGEIVNVNRTEDGAAITGRVEGAHRDVLDEEYYVRVLADRSLIGVTGVELLTGPGAAEEARLSEEQRQRLEAAYDGIVETATDQFRRLRDWAAYGEGQELARQTQSYLRSVEALADARVSNLEARTRVALERGIDLLEELSQRPETQETAAEVRATLERLTEKALVLEQEAESRAGEVLDEVAAEARGIETGGAQEAGEESIRVLRDRLDALLERTRELEARSRENMAEAERRLEAETQQIEAELEQQ